AVHARGRDTNQQLACGRLRHLALRGAQHLGRPGLSDLDGDHVLWNHGAPNGPVTRRCPSTRRPWRRSAARLRRRSRCGPRAMTTAPLELLAQPLALLGREARPALAPVAVPAAPAAQ